MKKQCGIYCIENKVNGKKYIGQSTNIQKRWYEHKRTLNKNIHDNKHLQRAWNNYGEDNFVFNIICLCLVEELNDLETKYINIYKANDLNYGYNMTLGGEGTHGFHWTEEEKRLIGKRQKGRSPSEETIQKQKDIWRQKIDNGYMPKIDHLRKYIDEQKVPIDCYDLNGNYISSYSSVHEAARILEIEATNISKVLKNKYHYTKGYVFYYSNNPKPDAISIFLRCSKNPVVLYSLDNQELGWFHNAIECGKYLNVDSIRISKKVPDKKKICHGYYIYNLYEVHPEYEQYKHKLVS